MYEPRWYRKLMGGERFSSFQITHFETDLWIGIDKSSYHPSMNDFVFKKCIEIRAILDNYIKLHPEFKISLLPFNSTTQTFPEIQQMIYASQKSGTGPMSAVAGMVAEYVGKALVHTYEINDLIVENGGDIYLDVKNDLEVAIFAGNSVLSNRIAVVVPASETPAGLCTSSGTVGHSLSFGKADAVMVACHDAALADAFATRLCNEVKNENDVERVLKLTEQFPEIVSIIIIIGDKMGVRGNFSIKPLV